MAILCAETGLLFVMVPGTGCSVVGKVLYKNFCGQYIPNQDIVNADGTRHCRKHNTVNQLIRDKLITSEQLDDLLVVANIRNPFDRLVTYWQRMAGDWHDYSFDVRRSYLERFRESFSDEDYQRNLKQLEAKKKATQRRSRVIRIIGFNMWLCTTIIRWRIRQLFFPSTISDRLFPMLDHVDVVIRHEQLEQGINGLLRLRNAEKSAALRRRNVTPGKKDYRSYYHWSTRALLSWLAAKPLAKFGYDFNGPTSSESLMWLNDAKQRMWTSSADTPSEVSP